jgi:glucosylglycerate phosphorylase
MESISALLCSLYGPKAGQEAVRAMATLLGRWAESLARAECPGKASALTERDAVLISYADQVREPDAPPLQTLAAFCERHLRGVVSGIHVLPFYPWSSDDGFSVKDFFAVDPCYGTWEDIQRLGTNFDLMFDGVFNHVSAQGEWFQRFLADDPRYRDYFILVAGSPDLSQVVRPRALPLLTEFTTASGPRRIWTTFSADQVDLNFKNPEVLLAVLEALLFYAAKGARFIRLDAIAFLWKEPGTNCLHLPQTHAVIRLLRAVLNKVAPHVRLITETNVPHAENLAYFGDGRNEAQLVYNFALPPLVLHSFATGNAEKLTRWAQSMALPSDEVTFFNFLASHDGIGLNPARGILSAGEIEALVTRTLHHGGFISCKDMPDGSRVPYELNVNYLDALSNPAEEEPAELVARRFLTAHAILLSLQGVPGLYFHSLFGSRGDRAGAEASGIPRRINREKLDHARLEADLATTGSLRCRVLAGQRELLHARQQHPAFAPSGGQLVLTLDARVFALLRQAWDGTDIVLGVHNVSPSSITLGLAGIRPGGRGWKFLWGCGVSPATGDRLVVEPYGSAWLCRASSGRAGTSEMNLHSGSLTQSLACASANEGHPGRG